MSDEVYTLGAWTVKPGKQDEFVEAWLAVGRHFARLDHPPGPGTLLQSVDEPTRFYSFGPWGSLVDVQAMREHPDTPAALGAAMALCDEAHPGTYRVVATA